MGLIPKWFKILKCSSHTHTNHCCSVVTTQHEYSHGKIWKIKWLRQNVSIVLLQSVVGFCQTWETSIHLSPTVCLSCAVSQIDWEASPEQTRQCQLKGKDNKVCTLFMLLITASSFHLFLATCLYAVLFVDPSLSLFPCLPDRVF